MSARVRLKMRDLKILKTKICCIYCCGAGPVVSLVIYTVLFFCRGARNRAASTVFFFADAD
jgi:hypothetical protein